jgi:hypothetical protein
LFKLRQKATQHPGDRASVLVIEMRGIADSAKRRLP